MRNILRPIGIKLTLQNKESIGVFVIEIWSVIGNVVVFVNDAMGVVG
jgi:hypothetical protein